MEFTFHDLVIIIGYILSSAGFVMALFLIASLRKRRLSPGSTVAWLMGFIFIPIIAIPLYFSFGAFRLRKILRKTRLDFALSVQERGFVPRSPLQKAIQQLPHTPPVTVGNETTFLFDGVEAYNLLLKEIDNAKVSISFTTFILSKDEVGASIIKALAKKAREGVKVRLLLDAVGSFRTRGSFADELREAGGEIAIFMPVIPIRKKAAVNLRMHRKLYLFDGERAIMGGKNLGSIYMGPEPNPNRWVDTSVLVRGPAVKVLTDVFAADWNFATEQQIVVECVDTPHNCGEVELQVIASGPDAEDQPLYEALVASLMAAHKRIWVVTPYFVPDETLLRLLSIQAKMGADVRILVPARGDHYIADLARRYPLRQLHNAGAKILFFQPKMIHAKLLVIDNDLASIGSPNMDMRSLYLNFELSLLVYSQKEIDSIAGFIESLYPSCTPYRRRDSRVGNFLDDILENVARILSPLV